MQHSAKLDARKAAIKNQLSEPLVDDPLLCNRSRDINILRKPTQVQTEISDLPGVAATDRAGLRIGIPRPDLFSRWLEHPRHRELKNLGVLEFGIAVVAS